MTELIEKNLYYVIAILLSGLIVAAGAWNYSNVIEARQNDFVTLSMNKYSGAKLDPQAMFNQAFFVKGDLGASADVFVISYKDSIPRTTTKLRATGKIQELPTTIQHPGYIKAEKDLVRSDVRGQMVVRGLYHVYINDEPYTFITQVELKDILKSNIIGITFPLSLPLLIFIVAFYATQEKYKSQKELEELKEAQRATKQIDLELQFREALLDESALTSETDKFGKIIRANKRFQEVSEYTLLELYKHDHRMLNSGMNYLDMDNKEFWNTMYEITVLRKDVWFALVINKTKSGKLYYINTWIKAKFDDEGILSGWLGVSHDVTEYLSSMKQIEKNNAILDNSAYMVRHDLLNPINVLKNYWPKFEAKVSEELLAGIKGKGSFNLIKKSLENLYQVYEGIFDFTAMVRKGATLRKQNIEVKDTLIDFFSRTAYGDSISIQRCGTILCNRGLFCNAVDNLVRNGMRYNDSSKKVIKIYIENDCLVIDDNGRGMTREDFIKYAEPHARNEQNKEGGKGLGLSISSIIAEKHGWELTCEKKETQGTKMIIKNFK